MARQAGLIIADDLTGANATAAILAAKGIPSFTQLDTSLPPQPGFEAVVYATDTRNREPSQAAKIVSCLTGRAGTADRPLVAKRIDSTLRGPIKAELDALLAHLPEALVLLCPAFPTAGRQCKDGRLSVHGVPLHQSDAARDPFWPMGTDRVAEAVGLAAQHLSLTSIRAGDTAAQLQRLYQQGCRVVVPDAETEQDIALVAKGAIESGLLVLPADPGPLTGELAARLLRTGCPVAAPAPARRVLFAIGSVAATSKAQVEQLLQAWPAGRVQLGVRALLQDEEREVARATKALQACCQEVVVLHTDSLYPQHRVDDIPEAVNLPALVMRSVAEVAVRCTQAKGIEAIVCTGGDITMAVCRRLGAPGMAIHGEVAPLIGAGALPDGLQLVTKGGMAGTPDAFTRCLAYLRGESK